MKFLTTTGLSQLITKVKAALNGKQDSISDLSTIRSGASAGATAVQPAAIAGFITKTVNDLTNYYLKGETYTRGEVQALISQISQFSYEVVATLPAASASTMQKIYLVPSASQQAQNVKDEFITLATTSGDTTTYSWEQIGSTSVDLSAYSTTAQMNAAIAAYHDSTKVDVVSGKGLSTNDYDATEKGNVASNTSARHSHDNKALLDTYTQTEVNLADAVSKKHDHSNKGELDLIAPGDKAKWDAKIDEPATEGTDGQVLATDGEGGRSWITPGGGVLTFNITVSGSTITGGKPSFSTVSQAVQDNKVIRFIDNECSVYNLVYYGNGMAEFACVYFDPYMAKVYLRYCVCGNFVNDTLYTKTITTT